MRTPATKFHLRSRAIQAILIVSLLVGQALAVGAGPGVYAQDEVAGTPEAGEPVEVVAEETPAAEVVDLPTEPDSPEIVPEPSETVEEDEGAAEESPAPTAEPIPATLEVFPDAAPHCIPVDEVVGAILPAGGSTDIQCEYRLNLAGSGVTLAEIDALWSVRALVPDGWSVSLRSSRDDLLAWDSPARTEVHWNDDQLDASAESFEGVADESTGEIAGELIFAFTLRIERDACSWTEGAVQIDVDGIATIPGRDDVGVFTEATVLEPVFIGPMLPPPSPVSPSVWIESVSVSPVRFSLEDQVATGIATVRVENPEVQCVDHLVSIHVADGLTNESPPIFVSSSVDGGPVVVIHQLPGQLIEAPVTVGFLGAATAAGASTLSIAFELTVPGGLLAGSFAVNVTAELAPVFP